MTPAPFGLASILEMSHVVSGTIRVKSIGANSTGKNVPGEKLIVDYFLTIYPFSKNGHQLLI